MNNDRIEPGVSCINVEYEDDDILVILPCIRVGAGCTWTIELNSAIWVTITGTLIDHPDIVVYTLGATWQLILPRVGEIPVAGPLCPNCYPGMSGKQEMQQLVDGANATAIKNGTHLINKTGPLPVLDLRKKKY